MMESDNPAPINNHRHPATITDVASLAGVSIATVSRVLNGTTRVSESTSVKVRNAIASLNFTPHLAARVLAARRTNTIGLILPEISGFFFSPLLRGIEEGLRHSGYELLVHSSVFRHEQGDPVTIKLGEYNTDGLLIFADSLDEAEITRLYSIGFPMVLLHQTPPRGMDIPCVTIENKAGARKLVDHLIEAHGHKKIAFLAGPSTEEDSYWREMGYRESLAFHNIPYDPVLISLGAFDAEIAQHSIHKMLDDGVVFDALFAGDDEAATGAIKALKHFGKRVPEDVAVVGFDDIYISQYLSPPLTTIHAPTEQVGYKAAEQLLRCIQHKSVDPLILLPTELIIRRSCNCEWSL